MPLPGGRVSARARRRTTPCRPRHPSWYRSSPPTPPPGDGSREMGEGNWGRHLPSPASLLPGCTITFAPMQEVKDITIIGAGPTGLFAAFYAGMRGATCCLIDNLDQVGGQLTALYPEKYIFDVAGFPKVLAKDLVKGMAEQAFQFKAPVHLGQKVIGLKRESQNGKPAFTVVTETDQYPSRTVLIAGGIGAFTPRKLPLKDVDRWYGKGLHDRILDPRIFTGKRVLLVGGGDSAFDWAVNLQGVAQRLLMIHRRGGFRAHHATRAQGQALCAARKMELRTFWEGQAIPGGDRGAGGTGPNRQAKQEA